MLVNAAMILVLVDRLSFFAAFYAAVEWYGAFHPVSFAGLLLANLLNWTVYKLANPPLIQLCVISFFTILANVAWIVIVGLR